MRGRFLLVGLLVAAAVVAGCGSSSSSSSSSAASSAAAQTSTQSSSASSSSAGGGIAAAQQLVQQMEQPPAWKGPTEKVDLSKAKGKHVYFVNLTEEIPALHEWSVVLGQQLQAAGVHTQDCDAKGTPEGITSCLTQALAAKPDAIVSEALDNAFIASYMKKAQDAGIKFITAQSGIPSLPTSPPGRDAEVSFNYRDVGQLLGAWFATDSQCKQGAAQVITTTSSREPSAAEVGGMQSAFTQYCPGLSSNPIQNVLIPDWPTKLPTVTHSTLLQNPNLKYLLPLYDGMTIYMVPSVRQLGRNDVKMAAFNATPVVMQNELAKPSALAADVGGPNQWFAVALADQTLRVLTGAKPVADENVPLRLFTRDNISSIDVSKDESTWYGSVNPICNYHKLWGLPC